MSAIDSGTSCSVTAVPRRLLGVALEMGLSGQHQVNGASRFQCPLVGCDNCTNGWQGQGLRLGYILKHLSYIHFNTLVSASKAKEIIGSDHRVFGSVESILRATNNWLCGHCLSFHAISKVCKNSNHKDFVVEAPEIFSDGSWEFCIAGLERPSVTLNLDAGDISSESFGLTPSLLDRVFRARFCTVKNIPTRCRLGVAKILKCCIEGVLSKPFEVSGWIKLFILPACVLRVVKGSSRKDRRSGNRKFCQAKTIIDRVAQWQELGGLQTILSDMFNGSTSDEKGTTHREGLLESNIRQCKRKIGDGHYNAAIKVLTSGGIAPSCRETVAALRERIVIL